MGPNSDIVVLRGSPLLPKISQKQVGYALKENSEPSPSSDTLFVILSLSSPGLHIPDKSPLISEKNTGTPASENDSAITFRVTVLPVPVAPAIRPCLFAKFVFIHSFVSLSLATHISLSLYIPSPSLTLYFYSIPSSQL